MVVLVCDLNHYHFKWHKQDLSHESQIFTIFEKEYVFKYVFKKCLWYVYFGYKDSYCKILLREF